MKDVNFCEQAISSSKEAIKARLTKSLSTLSSGSLETANREAVVDWHFELSQKMDVDIKVELNHWLYQFFKEQ